MAVLEGNIRSEAPGLSNRRYCRRPEAEETGHMALEKGPGCSSDRCLDGSQQDTQVADRICLPLWCLVYDLIGNAKSEILVLCWFYLSQPKVLSLDTRMDR